MTRATFELWDTDTANVRGDYPSEVAALAYVRGVVSRHGRKAVAIWELIRVAEDEDAETVVMGDRLADRACGSLPA